jgi:hypothetical protein
MQLFPALLLRNNQPSFFQDGKVLHHRLPRHLVPVAKLAKRLAIARMKPVQQMPPDRIGKRLEDLVHAHDNMQPKGYILCQATKYRFLTGSIEVEAERAITSKKLPDKGELFERPEHFRQGLPLLWKQVAHLLAKCRDFNPAFPDASRCFALRRLSFPNIS